MLYTFITYMQLASRVSYVDRFYLCPRDMTRYSPA